MGGWAGGNVPGRLQPAGNSMSLSATLLMLLGRSLVPADIAAVALHQKVDGLIVSNTTITRPGAIAEHPVGKEVRRSSQRGGACGEEAQAERRRSQRGCRQRGGAPEQVCRQALV